VDHSIYWMHSNLGDMTTMRILFNEMFVKFSDCVGLY